MALSQPRQRDFSLFTFHYSLFTKEEKVTPILHSSFYILHLFNLYLLRQYLNAHLIKVFPYVSGIDKQFLVALRFHGEMIVITLIKDESDDATSHAVLRIISQFDVETEISSHLIASLMAVLGAEEASVEHINMVRIHHSSTDAVA